MNRPDGGPQPRHAIEREGDAWTQVDRQVVSGAFRIASRADDVLTLERRADARRPGDIARVDLVRTEAPDAMDPFARGEFDLVTVRYTPRVADLIPEAVAGASAGPASWSSYIAFDHAHHVHRRFPEGPVPDVELTIQLLVRQRQRSFEEILGEPPSVPQQSLDQVHDRSLSYCSCRSRRRRSIWRSLSISASA